MILLTLLTRMLMAPLWETTAPFALFMLATVAAAWFAGPGPGVLVGAAGIAIRAYYDSPRGTDSLPTTWAEAVRMLLFAAFIAGTTVVLERMRRNARQLEETLARAQAEIEERQRTEDALRATERDLRRAIEEQQRMEEMLVAARLRAEEANRLKDEFLAMVSHELRTPLNTILGWSALIRTKALTPARTHHAIEAIDRNARHQAQLVGDLLDVARSLSGRLHLEITPVDFGAEIESAVAAIRDAAAAKPVHLVLSIQDQPLRVWGDARRLQQVACNLLSNAVKFTPPGGSVDVNVRKFEGCARLTVTDTGAGIAPEFLPRLFEHFSQAERGSTRTYGGLGLGLTLVRQLVELHRGSIDVESDGPSMGTRFTVLLPLHRSDRDPGDMPGPGANVPAVHPADA